MGESFRVPDLILEKYDSVIQPLFGQNWHSVKSSTDVLTSVLGVLSSSSRGPWKTLSSPKILVHLMIMSNPANHNMQIRIPFDARLMAVGLTDENFLKLESEINMEVAW